MAGGDHEIILWSPKWRTDEQVTLVTSPVPKSHFSDIELADFELPAAVHKYLRAQSGNFLAGTREARSVFHHQICREFFFSHIANFGKDTLVLTTCMIAYSE